MASFNPITDFESQIAMAVCNKAIEACATLPARLDAKQVAEILGFQEHDIPVLVRNELLQPLGEPKERKNTKKYFPKLKVLFLVINIKWLDRASKVVNQCWQAKNAGRVKTASITEFAAAA